jgi:REP element-mobilizing transposase RayT
MEIVGAGSDPAPIVKHGSQPPPRHDPERHHRRCIRLKGYDYSQPGAYFITICTQNRVCLLGDVLEGQMRLNDAGRMVERWWLELAHKFPTVALDAFVVMPNHIHGIIAIVGADLCVRPDDPRVRPDGEGTHDQGGTHAGVPRPKIIQWFKTMTTNEYIRHVKNHAWTPFCGRLWQHNYYEHIICNDESLNRIREYIATNPLRWHLDAKNPHRTGTDPEE